jgi:hypothetical protein
MHRKKIGKLTATLPRTTFLTVPDVNADLKLLPVPHAGIVEIPLAQVHCLHRSKQNKTSISSPPLLKKNLSIIESDYQSEVAKLKQNLSKAPRKATQ